LYSFVQIIDLNYSLLYKSLSYDPPQSVRKKNGVKKFTLLEFCYLKGLTGTICIGNKNFCINYDRLGQELPQYMQYVRFYSLFE
jgi:hypothetical protein